LKYFVLFIERRRAFAQLVMYPYMLSSSLKSNFEKGTNRIGLKLKDSFNPNGMRLDKKELILILDTKIQP